MTSQHGMKSNAIMSFTSIPSRIRVIDEVFNSHLKNAEDIGLRLVVSLSEDTAGMMTPYQRELVKSGRIDLITTPRDHGSNTKWTLARKKFPDAPMLVVDDDVCYGTGGLKRLMDAYYSCPDHIVCRTFRAVPWEYDRMRDFNHYRPWNYIKVVAAGTGTSLKSTLHCDMRYELSPGSSFPEHSNACVYPPMFPSLDPSRIPNEAFHDDDVMIGALACMDGVRIMFAGDCGDSSDRSLRLKGLWVRQWVEASNSSGKSIPRTCNAIKTLSEYFVSARKNSTDDCSPLWDKIGEAYVLTCSKYQKRRGKILSELGRIGLSAKEICDDMSIEPSLAPSLWGFDRCSLAHQRALEMFLDGDGDRCAIIEDDARFLCNADLIRMSLASIPEDFGALQLGWMPRYYFKSRKFAGFDGGLRDDYWSGKMWGEYNDASSNTFTVVSRDVAELWLEKLRSRCKDKNDNLLCDSCVELKRPIFASNPQICVQFDEGEGGTNTGRFFAEKERRGDMNPQLVPCKESYLI